jgi:uncharacterized protein
MRAFDAVRVLAFAACAVLPLAAVDTSKYKPTGYVNDFAGAFDQQSKVRMESALRQLDRAAGVQISVVTLLTLDGDPVEDVANRLYREWGIGKKETNEGALILLAVNDKKYRVEVGYGLEPILPDGYVGGLMRDVRPALAQRQYGAAIQSVVTEMVQRVAEKKNVALTDLPVAPRPVRSSGGGIPGWMIPLGIFLLFWIVSRFFGGGGGGRGMTGRRYGRGPVFFPGPFIGGGGGGWGGGGFGGGGSSSGGFGGFGGGDSGGGGASGSW